MKQILGLDLGTNSIGWALIKTDPQNVEGEILGLGSRILPMSQDVISDFGKGVSKSNTSERTRFRGVRRLKERCVLRRKRLIRVLNVLGFLPEHFKNKIDFTNRLGDFLNETDVKINFDDSSFLFKESFDEMLSEFQKMHPDLFLSSDKLIPYDWTIYYLRKKALIEKIEPNELAWLLLNFNQKRGYYQLRGEEEDTDLDSNKLTELHSLLVIDVVNLNELNSKKQSLYKIVLENGWSFVKPSSQPVEWKNKIKNFIVTTELDNNGNVALNKFGDEKRSFRAPKDDDWTLLKSKTELEIERSDKTVGEYIYDNLLKNPKQKIKGELVRTIERKFYKIELLKILQKQSEFYQEFSSKSVLKKCIKELYKLNEEYANALEKTDLIHLLVNDIIFYQRPLKSKKHLISNCRFEKRKFFHNGIQVTESLKCVSKSHPYYQEFRILQWMHNLIIFERERDLDITSELLPNLKAYEDLYLWLNDKAEISQDTLLKYFGKKYNSLNYRWNFVDEKEKKYPLNETRALLLSKTTKVKQLPADFLLKDIELSLWHLLYSINDKIELTKALKTFASKHIPTALSNEEADDFINDFIKTFEKIKPFDKDYGTYSLKALNKILPLLRFGRFWDEKQFDVNTHDRINKIIDGEYEVSIKNLVREKTISLTSINNFSFLPVWLATYVVYNVHAEDQEVYKWKTPADVFEFLKEFKQHSLRNPIVEQVVTETLRVVTEIWQNFGKGSENFFDEIHLELGRDLKNPSEKRKAISTKNYENENTNLRIKTILAELANDGNFENVRPYSHPQQEIFKIFEEAAINSGSDIPDDILKIAKSAQPSSAEINRYKMWLEQKYRSPYTGNIIPLSRLFTHDYEIEHVIPQSRFFDDSQTNKVICEAEVNKDKANQTGFEYIKNNSGKKIVLSHGKSATLFNIEQYVSFVNTHYAKNKAKKTKLLLEDIPESMVERQLNDTRYISKYVKALLSNIVRDEIKDEGVTSKNLLSTNGSITHQLKNDWGLNEIWNDIISPRFERLNQMTNSQMFGSINPNTNKFLPTVPLNLSRNFNKKRIDHRHHALDALVVALAGRNHINYLNNTNAIEKDKSKEEKLDIRVHLRNKLCHKKYNSQSNQNYNWVFKQPWPNFTLDAKNKLLATVVSFKKNLRIINKTVNYYQSYKNEAGETRLNVNGKPKKGLTKQVKGENWAIRKPLHKETVSGQVNLRFKKAVKLNVAIENCDQIVDKALKLEIQKLIKGNYDAKKIVSHFKQLNNEFNGKSVSQVEIYYFDDDFTASRVKLDESFNSTKIGTITDTGIQKIALNHLKQFNETVNGKIIEHPELAFSEDGLDQLNKNIVSLNYGKYHQPIFKVRTYDAKGNKFKVGENGNKSKKWVVAAKGTNLFFGVYTNENNKRLYETIPLSIVIERLKNQLPPVPEANSKGDALLFYLSPNDLVYVPTPEELEGNLPINLNQITPEIANRIYKVVSFTGNRLYAIPNNIATSVYDKTEFSSLNKIEFTIDEVSVKEHCHLLKFSLTGNLIK